MKKYITRFKIEIINLNDINNTIKYKVKLLMTLIFFLYSSTVDISDYTIKDIPGSSGRLDVISRCILAALFSCKKDNIDKNLQVWTFLEKYGTFIFNANQLNYDNFPNNELKFTDYFVDLIKKLENKGNLFDNPLRLIKVIDKSIIKVIDDFLKLDYKIYILHEKGDNFYNHLDDICRKDNVIFIIGNQIADIMDLEELKRLDIPRLSFGNQSYLASSIIRLIKLHMIISI